VVTVIFQASSTGSTVVEVNQVGFLEEVRAGHQAGWSDALRELARTIDPRDRSTS
jgi:hypothetical protein